MIEIPSVMKLVFLGLAVAGLFRKPALVDPDQGHYVCVGPNYSNDDKLVVAQDSLGNVLPFGEYAMHPGQQVCGRWQFRAKLGRFGYVVGSDTSWGAWFAPWQRLKSIQ